MLTDLQKRKIKNLFAVHDLDNDGVLRQRDFEEYTRRITTPRGWKPGSPEYDEVRSRFMTFWTGLTAQADTSHNHRVTIDEWFAYWDQLLGEQALYDGIPKPIADSVFHLLDENGDGEISAEEYSRLYSAGGLNPALAAEAFAKLDLDHDGRLSVDEMMTLLGQFFRSNDPTSPGNWLFGPF
jgi:Ca2+-binding EF-hand superfamily protein